MNGFLIVMSTTFDDFPIKLFGSESFALEWAGSCDVNKEFATACAGNGLTSAGDVLNLRIVKFVDGTAVSDDVVRDLEDEDDEEKGGA